MLFTVIGNALGFYQIRYEAFTFYVHLKSEVARASFNTGISDFGYMSCDKGCTESTVHRDKRNRMETGGGGGGKGEVV